MLRQVNSCDGLQLIILSLDIIELALIGGTTQGVMCIYPSDGTGSQFGGQLLNGYSFLGYRAAADASKAITWANQGQQSGILAVVDAFSRNNDFTFYLPPITTVIIDETNKELISNTYAGYTFTHHYLLSITERIKRV
jgi:hypothetical protein